MTMERLHAKSPGGFQGFHVIGSIHLRTSPVFFTKCYSSGIHRDVSASTQLRRWKKRAQGGGYLYFMLAVNVEKVNENARWSPFLHSLPNPIAHLPHFVEISHSLALRMRKDHGSDRSENPQVKGLKHFDREDRKFYRSFRRSPSQYNVYWQHIPAAVYFLLGKGDKKCNYCLSKRRKFEKWTMLLFGLWSLKASRWLMDFDGSGLKGQFTSCMA